MGKTCENCFLKLDCKVYTDLYAVLTEPEFCGKINDASERMRVRSKMYHAIGVECNDWLKDQ